MAIEFFMPSRTKTELYVLKTVSELLKKSGSNVAELKDIAGHLHKSIDATDSLLESLGMEGLIKYIKHAYGCDAGLSPAGANRISEIDDFLSSPSKKQKYLRDMYLTWVYDQNTIEKFPEGQEFLVTHPAVFGCHFTESNVMQAEKELKEREFIQTDELTPGLAITAKGQDYVDGK